MAKLKNSETLTETDQEGNTSHLVSRYNHNIPHVAVAMVTSNLRSGSYLPAVSGLLLYLCLVFYLVSQLLERFFVAPVLMLARSAEQIARGNDVWDLALPTGDEFEELNKSFSELVVGLQQRNMLRDYVSEDAISQIELAGTKDMAPGGEYIEATIIFAAIKNYSGLTADLTPEQTVDLINRFITSGDNLVKKHGGTIDKIIDNTLMLVFRDNETRSDSHALRAVRTALELASEMRQQNLDIYAGIASGTVISGRIGSYSGKLDFTVIGDQVNLAARLKNEAVDSASGLIISGSTMRQLKGAGRVNFLRRCSLKGKSREYNIYELYELR
jgi:class 3 adenylate cyclase